MTPEELAEVVAERLRRGRDDSQLLDGRNFEKQGIWQKWDAAGEALMELLAVLDRTYEERDRWNRLSLETANELSRALGPYADTDALIADRVEVERLREALLCARAEIMAMARAGFDSTRNDIALHALEAIGAALRDPATEEEAAAQRREAAPARKGKVA